MRAASRGSEALALARAAGVGFALRTAGRELWSTTRFLGLRCDLAALPPVPAARIPLVMEPQPSGPFAGFADELRRTSDGDALEILLRMESCAAGVQTLDVARAPDGEPAYCQWLVRAADQARLHAHAPDRYPQLASDEVLLEGAYTFVRYRRLGAMADGMGQLVRIARDGGARAAITYVGDGNVASLRGCARVGFALDHVRRNSRRAGVYRSSVEPAADAARDAWERATARRE